MTWGSRLNFEVEMDAVSLLSQAVDVLISKIGTDEKLTKLLIDYSLEKTDDDKSWDISKDLNEFAKVLLNEDDVQHFRKLVSKELEDFFDLKKQVTKRKYSNRNRVQETWSRSFKIYRDEWSFRDRFCLCRGILETLSKINEIEVFKG